MKFSYTALSAENKQLNGLLEAADLEAAKNELHKMEVSIITIEEISNEEYAKRKEQETAEKAAQGIQTFEFKAVDPTGKEVDGTIDAIDDEAAFKRLIAEYKFDVKTLGTPGQDEVAAATRLKELRGILEGKGEKTAPEKEKAEEETKVDEKQIAEIDKIIKNTKEMIAQGEELFSAARMQEINAELGELERVRTSNNIKHITEVSKQLYKLISEPDAAPKETLETKPEYKSLLGEMSETNIVKSDMNLYEKAIADKKLQSIFGQISGKLSFLKKKEAAAGAEKVSPKEKLKSLFTKKPKLKAEDIIGKKEETTEKQVQKADKKPSMWTNFFVEVDSFFGWLLCFYILYFFLADFALEKQIGIPGEFALKTLQTPLLINITLFLLMSHLIFRVKNLHFQKNILGSLFLFFFGYGIYAFVIVNF